MKIFILSILLSLHPVHVSLTGIDYNPESRTYNIFIKVYSDDLKSDMKITTGITEENNLAGLDGYLIYLTDRVKILEDGKLLKMKILNAESDGVEQRFILGAKGRRNPEKVTVINRIMTRLHSDQSNMCLFKFSDIEEGYKFTVYDTIKNYSVK